MNNQNQVLIDEMLLKQLAKSAATMAPVKSFAAGEASVYEVIYEFEINGIKHCLARCKPTSDSAISLSSRELAIARLIAQGLPNKCIGTTLQISHWTVNTYLRRIFGKLGVTSRAAMVMRLMEAGLLQPDDRYGDAGRADAVAGS